MKQMVIGPTLGSLHSERGTKHVHYGQAKKHAPHCEMVFPPKHLPFKPAKGHQPNTTACPQSHTHAQSLTGQSTPCPHEREGEAGRRSMAKIYITRTRWGESLALASPPPENKARERDKHTATKYAHTRIWGAAKETHPFRLSGSSPVPPFVLSPLCRQRWWPAGLE